MNHKLLELSGTDEQVADSLQKLGYVPVSLRSRIKKRIEGMHSDFYSRAMALFQRFTLDPIGNETVSPLTYQRERLYPESE